MNQKIKARYQLKQIKNIHELGIIACIIFEVRAINKVTESINQLFSVPISQRLK